jgi:hypothetical protein
MTPMSYQGRSIHDMTESELLDIIIDLSLRLQAEYEEKQQRLKDPAYVEYLSGIRYGRTITGLYKRTLNT